MQFSDKEGDLKDTVIQVDGAKSYRILQVVETNWVFDLTAMDTIGKKWHGLTAV